MMASAQRSADFSSALALIERATGDALNPLTLHNHGRILDAAERYDEAAGGAAGCSRGRAESVRCETLSGPGAGAFRGTASSDSRLCAGIAGCAGRRRWLNEGIHARRLRPWSNTRFLQVKQGRCAMIARCSSLCSTYGRDSMRRVDKSLRVYFNQGGRRAA